jgi:poly-gamma-glutamate synthesis protein (capsule biosynthesis protein)
MAVTLALAGDTMLGRGVADLLAMSADPAEYVSEGIRDHLAEADLFLLNLECCISNRGDPWPTPGKLFHFRAPPEAADFLAELGVGCVTIANNHALDFGYEALLDTRGHLARAGIAVVGAGADESQARETLTLPVGGIRIGIVGVTDHPADFAAAPDRPGVAFADLSWKVPSWLLTEVRELRLQADVVLVTPHWGPNRIAEPLPYIRSAAQALVNAGATLVAGHSAHVFHGVAPPVAYDLGDFVDDYAVYPDLRNDLSLLFLVTIDDQGPVRLRALPIALEYCRTRLARDHELAWIRNRFVTACAEMDTEVIEENGTLVVPFR